MIEIKDVIQEVKLPVCLQFVLHSECLELNQDAPLYSWGTQGLHYLYPLKARKRDIIKHMLMIITT